MLSSKNHPFHLLQWLVLFFFLPLHTSHKRSVIYLYFNVYQFFKYRVILQSWKNVMPKNFKTFVEIYLVSTCINSFIWVSKSNENQKGPTGIMKSRQSILWIRRCIIKWSRALVRYRNRDRKESLVSHYRVHNMQRQPGCPTHALLIAITLRRRLNTLLLARPSLSKDM